MSPKDYIDLYLIVEDAGYALDHLVAQAKQKLLGLDEWTVGLKFDRVSACLISRSSNATTWCARWIGAL